MLPLVAYQESISDTLETAPLRLAADLQSLIDNISLLDSGEIVHMSWEYPFLVCTFFWGVRRCQWSMQQPYDEFIFIRPWLWIKLIMCSSRWIHHLSWFQLLSRTVYLLCSGHILWVWHIGSYLILQLCQLCGVIAVHVLAFILNNKLMKPLSPATFPHAHNIIFCFCQKIGLWFPNYITFVWSNLVRS